MRVEGRYEIWTSQPSGLGLENRVGIRTRDDRGPLWVLEVSLPHKLQSVVTPMGVCP